MTALPFVLALLGLGVVCFALHENGPGDWSDNTKEGKVLRAIDGGVVWTMLDGGGVTLDGIAANDLVYEVNNLPFGTDDRLLSVYNDKMDEVCFIALGADGGLVLEGFAKPECAQAMLHHRNWSTK